MATYERLDYGSPDGCQIGGAAADLVAFHGSVPVNQADAVTSISTTAPTTSSPYGFVGITQASALVGAVNSIIALLKEKGLMAT